MSSMLNALLTTSSGSWADADGASAVTASSSAETHCERHEGRMMGICGWIFPNDLTGGSKFPVSLSSPLFFFLSR